MIKLDNENFGFTAEDYAKFRQNIPKMQNQPFRSEGVSFFEAMMSEGNDWLSSVEGQKIIDLIKDKGND